MQQFNLNKQQKDYLLSAARNRIIFWLKGTEYKLPQVDEDETLNLAAGVFVSVYINNKLRGCIGTFNMRLPLVEMIEEMSISAATSDTRFKPVMETELDDLNVEISVLTPLKKNEDINEIELGRHGVYIKQGLNKGTFLPQVATKTGWDLEGFLGHCARDKAQI